MAINDNKQEPALTEEELEDVAGGVYGDDGCTPTYPPQKPDPEPPTNNW
jgi:hypothetical protein